MPQGIVKPANQIIIHGDPVILEMEVGANATAAKMLPGNLVIFDSADSTVKEAGIKADNVIGIIDVAPDKLESDTYAVGDQVKIITGPDGIIVKLRLKASENVTRGDALVAAADGQVAKQAVGAMGAQGSVIGIALESSNVTTIAEVAVLLRQSTEPAAAS
jgi:hypothetical protein